MILTSIVYSFQMNQKWARACEAIDVFDHWCTPPPAQEIKNPHLNCSTTKQPINKQKVDPNRYVPKLSDEPKNSRIDPEFVKQLIYLMHPSCTRHQKLAIELLHKSKTYQQAKS